MILSQILFGLHQEKFQEVCINFEAKQNRRYCEGSRVSSKYAEGGKVMHSCSRLKWQSYNLKSEPKDCGLFNECVLCSKAVCS